MSHYRTMCCLITLNVLIVPIAIIDGGCSSGHNPNGYDTMDEIEKRTEEFKKLRDMIIVQVVDLPDQDTLVRVGRYVEDERWIGTIFANSEAISYMDPVANQPDFFSAQGQVYSEVEFFVEFLTGTEDGKLVKGSQVERYCGQVRFFANNGSEEKRVYFMANMTKENWTPFYCLYQARVNSYEE